MRIDLHSHSALSDGTDSPSELIARAASLGLDVIALTDHDHANGWTEAQAAADAHGIRFVRGIEISTKHGGEGVHLLGYEFDPTHPPLAAELESTLRGRSGRLDEWVRRAAEHGMPVPRELIVAKAQASDAVSKNHLADAMIELGHIQHRDYAFDNFFGPGQPFHVRRHATATADAIRLVVEAGGVPVIAHPWARSSRDVLDVDAFKEFRELGLRGIEVDHQMHSADVRAELRALAADLDLVVTGSSDYHGFNKADHELGCNTTSPDQFERLFEGASVR